MGEKPDPPTVGIEELIARMRRYFDELKIPSEPIVGLACEHGSAFYYQAGWPRNRTAGCPTPDKCGAKIINRLSSTH